MNNRFISEGCRLVSDVLEITNSLDIEGDLMTVDIEKAFDSINHSFLCVLKKTWELCIINPELCIIDDGKATLYLTLER